MNTVQITITVILVLMLSSVTSSSAQRRGGFNLSDGLSITPKGGYNLFFGDLVDESRGSFSVGVMADREISNSLSLRSQLIGGKMQGKQVFSTSGLVYAEFDNIYTEFTIGGAYRPLNHLLGYFRERRFQPYVHLGAGLVYFSATEYWGPASPGTPGEEWRTASGVAPVVAMGGGTSIWISPIISLNLELTGSLPFSDQLDVHDVWYATYEDWENKVNAQTTNPNDFYYTFTVGVSFLIEKSGFSNNSKYNRRSYIKTRNYYNSKNKRRSFKRPKQKKFLFF
ncbi:hypothetical protein ACT29H_08530 [Thermophagus sp. OGC60D27]|uniref:hypothetical protein n=1 Tax=Thermophagus sp. OGC60D27 TaxID=3458415 RepID=UPI0040384B66